MIIDTSNSTVNFAIKKLFFLTVNGTLPEVKGEVKFDVDKLSEASIALRIPVAGLDTKNAKRDEHLMQADFFDVEQYPEIQFIGNVIKNENKAFLVKGDLSIAGNTKTVEIPFQFNNNRATGSFSLNRADFNFGKIPTFVAANIVDITFDITLK